MLDSDVIEGCVDPVLLPDVRATLIGYTLDPPKRLLRISNSIVKADAEGNERVIFTDANGRKLNVLILMLVARGMKCPVSTRGFVTRFEQNRSYLRCRNTVIPLKHDGGDLGQGL